MDAGLLDRRVILQRNYPAQDSNGDPVPDWQDLATVWAGIRPATGREIDAEAGTLAEADTIIHLRYSPLTAGLSPVDRIRYGARIYNVIRVRDIDEAHHEVRVMVTSGLNDG